MHPHVRQDLAELVAALLLHLERARQAVRVDLAAVDQDLAETLEYRTFGRRSHFGKGGHLLRFLFEFARHARTCGRPAS
jgi:hypothetical protein